MSMSTGCHPRRSKYLEELRRKRRETIYVKSESDEEEERIYKEISDLCTVKRRIKWLITDQYKKLERIRKHRELRKAILMERMRQEEKRRKELREERLDLFPELKNVATQTESIQDGSILNELDLPTDLSSAAILNFKSKDGHSMGHLDTNLGNALETITAMVDSNDAMDFTIRKVPAREVPVTSKYFDPGLNIWKEKNKN